MYDLKKIGSIKMSDTDKNVLIAQALKEKGFIVKYIVDGMHNKYHGEFLDIFEEVTDDEIKLTPHEVDIAIMISKVYGISPEYGVGLMRLVSKHVNKLKKQISDEVDEFFKAYENGEIDLTDE